MKAEQVFTCEGGVRRGWLRNVQVFGRCLALFVQQAFLEPQRRARDCGRQGHGTSGLGKQVRLSCVGENRRHECDALDLRLRGMLSPCLAVLGPPSRNTTDWGLEH